MKIYTKNGDKGKTSLYNGDIEYKNHQIFDCLGALDELNASLAIVSIIYLLFRLRSTMFYKARRLFTTK